jgi:hypothetical protein
LVQVHPLEREGRDVRCSKAKNLKLVEFLGRPAEQSALGFRGFLDWMLVFLAVRRPGALAFIRGVGGRAVDSDDANANRTSPGPPKFLDLANEVPDDAVDLFESGFEQRPLGA